MKAESRNIFGFVIFDGVTKTKEDTRNFLHFFLQYFCGKNKLSFSIKKIVTSFSL
jgi:hypothetical protein